MLTTLMSVCLLLILVMVTLSMGIKSQPLNMKEKQACFECGFDPSHNTRDSFSLRFFIITVIFLIFDMEIAIMFPVPMSNNSFNFYIFYIFNMILTTLLLGGLLEEWKEGTLSWNWDYI